MSCVSPPEIENVDLLAYVDGHVDTDVIEHLRSCPHCRARAQAIAKEHSILLTALYRFACPSPHELGEYQLGLLNASRSAFVSEHIKACGHCSAEVAELTRYLHELEPDIVPSPIQAIRRLVARLAKGLSQQSTSALRPTMQPALAGVRGTEPGPQVYEAGEIQIAVSVDRDPQNPGTFKALGLAAGGELSGARVGLWRSGEELASEPIGEFGGFVFAGVAPGECQLVIRHDDLEILIPHVVI